MDLLIRPSSIASRSHPRPTSQLARTFVDRCTDTAHHAAFSSLAPREFLLYFRFSYGLKRRTSLHQKTAGWSSRGGEGGATAPSQQVLCAHPNHIRHPSSPPHWISLDLIPLEEQSTKCSSPPLILAKNEGSRSKFTAEVLESFPVPIFDPREVLNVARRCNWALYAPNAVSLPMHSLFVVECFGGRSGGGAMGGVWVQGVGAGQVGLREAGWPQAPSYTTSPTPPLLSIQPCNLPGIPSGAKPPPKKCCAP